jgi:hypothetical protein
MYYAIAIILSLIFLAALVFIDLALATYLFMSDKAELFWKIQIIAILTIIGIITLLIFKI